MNKYLNTQKYYDNEYYGSQHKKSRDKIVRVSGLGNNAKLVDYFDIRNRGGKFLDIACGTGWLLKAAQQMQCDCYGVDCSKKAIEAAYEKCGATLYCRDVNSGFPYFENSKFDYIACIGSLEHFNKQELVLKEMARMCKKDGRIIIIVPNENYILHKFGYETDDQPVINRYGLNGWKELLEKNGCMVKKVMKENSHLSNLDESSSYPRFIMKLLAYSFIRLIPIKWSFNFVFICAPK